MRGADDLPVRLAVEVRCVPLVGRRGVESDAYFAVGPDVVEIDPLP